MKPIERIRRDLTYHGAVIDVYTDTVRVPNGKLAKWDFIGHLGAAAVIPVLPDGRILLVRQYRNALDRFTLELPAGKKDSADEELAVCAARELEEETGYRCDELEHLISVNTTVAFCDELIGIFVARNLVRTQQHLDEEEEVEVEAFALDELIRKIFAREMTDAKTVAGILAYRESLRTGWAAIPPGERPEPE